MYASLVFASGARGSPGVGGRGAEPGEDGRDHPEQSHHTVGLMFTAMAVVRTIAGALARTRA
jgi:hypothetical protein